jgi:hypothetical protein
MRKNLLCAGIIMLLCGNVEAQYKKASFLTKSGRTHEVGGMARFLSSAGAGTMPSFYYGYGRDKGKRLFHWFDLELMFPTNFKYSTYEVSSPQDKVEVSGKSKIGLAYRYNLAGYLTNPESESKIKPFATLGINVMIVGGTAKSYTTYPEFADPYEVPPFSSFSYGGNAGLGAIYNFSNKVGIKAAAGFNYQGLFNGSEFDGDNYKAYNFLGSHPYFSLGVRFTMEED